MSVNYYNKTTGELENIAGSGTGGADYDIESSANKDSVILTENETDKTTLPLISEFIGTRAQWDALSATDQSKYRKINITDEYFEGDSELSKRIDISGSKNVVPYPYMGINTNTIFLDNGITYSVNSAREIIVNGTSSSQGSYCNIANVGEYLERNVPYVLSGCPSGGSTSSYYLSYENRASSIDVKDVGGSVEFTLTQGEDLTDVSLLKIVIAPNTTVTNLTFKPMIRLASIQDDTYYPYAKTNRELTENVNVIDGKISSYDNSIYSLKAKTGFGAYYDSTKSYSVGKYVVQSLNGYEYIFKCTTACSAASWDVNKNNFTMTSLASAVSELNSDLTQCESDLKYIKNTTGMSTIGSFATSLTYTRWKNKYEAGFTISFAGNPTVNTWMTLCTVPAEIRPAFTYNMVGTDSNGTAFAAALDTNGVIKVVSQQNSLFGARIQAHYPIQF